MPPRLTYLEIKAAKLKHLDDEFWDKFNALLDLKENPDTDPMMLKQALNDYQPCLIAVTKLIEEETKSTTMSDALHRIIARLQHGVGYVYTCMGHFEKARKHLKAAIKADYSLIPYGFLAALELAANRPKELKKARELLLAAAIQPKHADNATFSELGEHALALLDTYLNDPQPDINLDDFFAKYEAFLGIDGYCKAFEFSREEHWCDKIITYITHHPKVYQPEFNCYYDIRAYFYLNGEKYTQCFNFTKANSQKFSPDKLSAHATALFGNMEVLSEDDLTTIKSWLTQAAETGSPFAVTKYLLFFAHCDNFFNPKKALAIANKACEDPDLQGLAYYCLGLYHKSKGDDAAAFNAFQSAVDSGHPESHIRLGIMHAGGIGTAVSHQEAIKYLKIAHESDSDYAGIVWAEILINISSTYDPFERLEMLSRALKLLTACEQRSDKHLDKIALTKANCLFELSNLESQSDATTQDNTLKLVRTSAFEVTAAARIEALEYAAKHGKGMVKVDALINLACYHCLQTDKDANLTIALEHLQTALRINRDHNKDNTSFEHCILMLCGAVLQMASDRATGPNKKNLQIKALAYFQEVMDYQDMDIPAIVKVFANKAYLKEDTATNENSAEDIFRHFSKQLNECSKYSWKNHVSALKALLNDPRLEKTADTLGKITEHVVAINEHLLDDPSLLPLLQQVVSDCVAAASHWKPSELLSAFANVSRWHLASATAELAPLFMYYKSHFASANLAEQCQAISIITKCNFKPELQEVFLPALLRHLPPCPPAGAEGPRHPEAPPQYPIEEASRLFHTLALLDCNHPNPLYSTLANQLFTTLKPIAKHAGDIEVSQLFHAYHYFRSYYPKKSWTLGADLRKHFDTYRSSQCIHKGLVSENQEKIHELLEPLLPQGQLKQEAFIELVGRRVDFLVGQNVIIQYNGTRFHNLWDNQGKRDYASLKEQLCYKTLTAPNAKKQYYVLRIDRTTWANLKNDDERREYLQNRLSTVPIQFTENRDASERKMPFLSKASKPFKPETEPTSSLTIG